MPARITLSADEVVIERALERARRQGTTLDAAFRRWLERYATEESARDGFDALMKRLELVESGGRFTRDERGSEDLQHGQRVGDLTIVDPFR